MRTIALSVVLCALAASAALRAASNADTPYTRVSKLASYLSDGEPVGALEAFDKKMPGYSAVAADIQAMAAQSEVLCSIDVVQDKEAADDSSSVHHLDLDWYMMLKSRADEGLVERRRQRVAVTLEKEGRGWRITAISPEQILAPLAVR